MTTIYLWCRAWPWFLPGFPFEQFDELEGRALTEGLEALAQDWDEEHHGVLAHAREKEARLSVRRRNGTPFLASLGRIEKPARASAPLGPRPATFREVAVLAEWVFRPPRIVVERRTGSGESPTAKVYFLSVEDEGIADTVLDALRERIPSVLPGGPFRVPGIAERLTLPGADFGSGHAVVRYGKVRANELDITRRTLIARGLEDFRERRDPDSAWAARIAEEAARIEAHLQRDLCAEHSGAALTEQRALNAPLDTLSPKERTALESYEWMISQRPELLAGGLRNYAQVHEALKNAIEAGPEVGSASHDAGCPHYRSLQELPEVATWSRYVSKGFRLADGPQNEPRSGRQHGSSVVEREEI